ncbi:hypothetical protein ACJX0J_022554, partial [Zea mays]
MTMCKEDADEMKVECVFDYNGQHGTLILQFIYYIDRIFININFSPLGGDERKLVYNHGLKGVYICHMMQPCIRKIAGKTLENIRTDIEKQDLDVVASILVWDNPIFELYMFCLYVRAFVHLLDRKIIYQELHIDG